MRKISRHDVPIDNGTLASIGDIQYPDIDNAHQRASDSAEYGVNWYEWVNTEEALVSKLVVEAWDRLTPERQLAIIEERIEPAESRVRELKNARDQITGSSDGNPDWKAELIKMEHEISSLLGDAMYGYGEEIINGEKVQLPRWGDHVAITLVMEAARKLKAQREHLEYLRKKAGDDSSSS